MTNKNYISVTAGKDAEEVNALLEEFQKAGYSLNQKHVPVVGIQISEKTLNGIRPRNFRFAKFAEVPSLLKIINGKAMPIIHYNTRNKDTLFEQISRVFEKNRSYCNIVQLNVNFPDISQLEKIKDCFNGLKISLQVDYRDRDLEKIPDKVAYYGDCLDYVLLDPSRGRGDAFNIDSSAYLYLKIKEKRPDYGIVLAGGFSGDTAEEILTSIISRIKTKEFSVCAEGKLRDKINYEPWGQDILNIEKARKYLQAVKKILD